MQCIRLLSKKLVRENKTQFLQACTTFTALQGCAPSTLIWEQYIFCKIRIHNIHPFATISQHTEICHSSPSKLKIRKKKNTFSSFFCFLNHFFRAFLFCFYINCIVCKCVFYCFQFSNSSKTTAKKWQKQHFSRILGNTKENTNDTRNTLCTCIVFVCFHFFKTFMCVMYALHFCTRLHCEVEVQWSYWHVDYFASELHTEEWTEMSLCFGVKLLPRAEQHFFQFGRTMWMVDPCADGNYFRSPA